jgi:hypothetical protein
VLGKVRQGELPAVRAETAQGRPWRVRRSDVDALVAGARVQPGALAHLHPPRRSGRSSPRP